MTVFVSIPRSDPNRRLARNFKPGHVGRGKQANNEAGRTYIRSNLFLRHAHLALRYLAWLNLLWVIPMIARWRVVARGSRQRDLGC